MSDAGSPFPPPTPPGSISGDGPSKAWWKRWWVITIAAVVVLVVIAAIAGGGSDGDSDSVSTTTADRTEPSDSEAPDESAAQATSDAAVATDAPSTALSPSGSGPRSTTTGAPVTTSSPSSGKSVSGTPDGLTGDRSSPVAAGSIADIGDGYRLQVLSVTEDATAEVMTENQFNAPPPAGSRFTIVDVALGYYGLDDPQAGLLTTISAVGAGNKELDSNCGVIPNELDRFNDIFGGGVIRGNLCFITTPADGGVLQIYASTGFTGDDVFLDASATPSALADMPTLPGVQSGTSSAPARQSRRRSVPVWTSGRGGRSLSPDRGRTSRIPSWRRTSSTSLPRTGSGSSASR